MIIVRPINNREPDILIGLESLTLKITDLEGNEVTQIMASNGHWTYDALESIDFDDYSPEGWNAYLGTNWIGSSEV